MSQVIKYKQTAVVLLFCDECGKRCSNQCVGCNKHLCAKCGNWWYRDPFTDNDNGDYPDIACDCCHKLACQIAPQAIEALENAYNTADELRNKWKELSQTG